MSVQVITASPIEAEAYYSRKDVNEAVDAVGEMILDLHEDDDFELSLLYAMNDVENPEEFTLAFSGSTLSLEFFADRIEVTDFNEGDEEILEVFERSETNAATVWLVNRLTS